MSEAVPTTNTGLLTRTHACLWVTGAMLAAMELIPLCRTWQLAPDLGHGWAAPILIAYLWWERWPQRPSLAPRRTSTWSAGLVLAIILPTLLALRLLLEPYPLWPMALLFYVSLLVGLALWGSWLLAGRQGVRWIGGALLMLPAVMPWPSTVETSIILPIREAIAMLVAEISNLAGHPALATGTSIKLGSSWVGIDEACGGIRSLQATVLAALFAGEWLLLTARRRIALVGFGIFAAIAGNFGRVLFLSWCALQGGDLLHRWHDPAGWLALGFSIAITSWIAWRWRSSSPPDAIAATPRDTSAKPSPVVLAWMLGVAGILGLIEVSNQLWYTYGGTQNRVEVPQWTVRLPAELQTYRNLPLPEVSREMLMPDFFTSGTWNGSDQIARTANYIEWHTGQAARSIPFTHNPTICLPNSGFELIKSLGLINVPWEGGIVIFHSFVFRQMDQDMLVAFTIWDPMHGQLMQSVTPETRAEWWLNHWQVVREARLDQPAQMLSFAIRDPDHPERLPAELGRLLVPAPEHTEETAPYWLDRKKM